MILRSLILQAYSSSSANFLYKSHIYSCFRSLQNFYALHLAELWFLRPSLTYSRKNGAAFIKVVSGRIDSPNLSAKMVSHFYIPVFSRNLLPTMDQICGSLLPLVSFQSYSPPDTYLSRYCNDHCRFSDIPRLPFPSDVVFLENLAESSIFVSGVLKRRLGARLTNCGNFYESDRYHLPRIVL